MKAIDIKEYEEGEHCFGPILEVNGIEYNDIPKEEAIEFITDMLHNTYMSDSLIREVFQIALSYLDSDVTESHNDSCEQCGNWNYSNKHKITQ